MRRCGSNLNGVQVVNVAQPAFTIAGSANLKVGAYATSAGLFPGAVMDEFRLYVCFTQDMPTTLSDPLEERPL